jgi:hypothetical protein
VFTVNVEVPVAPVTVAGLSEQLGERAPAGATLQIRATSPVKPTVGAIVMVDVAVPPAATEAGERAAPEIVKSGPGVTVRLTVVP